MATHSSILAYKISWTGEPCGLQSMVSQSQTRLRTHTQQPFIVPVFFVLSLMLDVHYLSILLESPP